MDIDLEIEQILSRANESFRSFEDELNAHFDRTSSIISGSSISSDSLITTQSIMPLPTNYVGSGMDEFMREWMEDKHDLLGQSIVDNDRSTRSNSIEQAFLLMYHNTSGMKSKIHDLNDYLHLTKYDMLLFAETWYDETIDSINITAGTNYLLYRRDRSSNAGGVAIAINNSINVAKYIQWPQLKHIEVLTLYLEKECVTLIYWPPRTDKSTREAATDEFLFLLCELRKTKMSQLLIGDFNMPGLRWSINVRLKE